MQSTNRPAAQRNLGEFLFLVVEEAGSIFFNLGALLAVIAFFGADWNYALYALAS